MIDRQPMRRTTRSGISPLAFFAAGVASYAPGAGFVAFLYSAGEISGAALAALLSLAVVINGVFYACFAAGLNERCRERFLAREQIAVGLCANWLVLAVAGPYRDAYLALCVVPMLFGALRLSLAQMLRLAAWNQCGHLAMIAVLYRLDPHAIDVPHEMLLWLIVGVQMLWISGVAAMVGRLRNRLIDAYKEADRLAAQDPLTGVMNRRALLEHLASSPRPGSGDRRGEPGAFSVLALADLDHFKRVNDSYGHDAGDRLLAAFAQALRRSIRATDAVGRFGGDEFLIHLRVRSIEQAQQTLARIQAAVAAMTLSGYAQLKPSASIGAVVLRDGESAEDALQRADALLYRIKRSGRGKVVLAPEDEQAVDAGNAVQQPGAPASQALAAFAADLPLPRPVRITS